MSERVFITGLGIVAPLGTGQDAYWTGLLRGRGMPREHPSLDRERVPNRLFYSVDHEVNGVAGPEERLPRGLRLAVRAAGMCIADAGIAVAGDAVVGVSIGTGMGTSDVLESGRANATELTPADHFVFGISAAIAAEHGCTGPNLSVSTACSAGGYSVGIAADAIRSGMADAMITGGAEGICRVPIACFNRLGALDPVTCRPFDSRRAGTVFGEGAAIMVLESESHFRARSGKRVYAELKGSGWSCDGHHPTAPEPSGGAILAALRDALRDAGVAPGEVDCVVPHGTGTELNDLVESRVLREFFGERADQLLTCAIKSMVGHGGGAAGAFSVLTAAMIVDRGMVPPTANVSEVDPRCDWRLHRDGAVSANVRNVLVNAYAFGGNNISVVLGKPHGV